MTAPAGYIRHLLAATIFLALSVLWTWPLLPHLSTAIPGRPGDNFWFLWNSWWMRAALANGQDFFRTDRLFAPFGIDLVLHTHTALSSWLAATVFGRLPVVVAHNVVILLTLACNGFAAYLLAWDRLRVWSAAVVAGLIYGGSPYIAAHLLGHVNLLSAWGLPLLALLFLRVLERGSLAAAIGAALVICATGFNDYYYVVYAGALLVALYLSSAVSLTWSRHAVGGGARRLLIALLVVDLVLIAAILVTGGWTAELFGLAVSATAPGNLLTVAWALGLTLLVLHWRPRLRWRRDEARAPGAAVAAFVGLGVVAAGLSPLWRRGWQLYLAGDYTAPESSWKSGPAGVDLAALVLGPPYHGVFGQAVRQFYQRLSLDAVEGVAWLGVVPILLAAAALIRHGSHREVRLWRGVAAFFFIWALGPWLHIAGLNTGLLLPQNLLAQLPLLSNARIPGRAMVLVYLAAAMLVAMWLSTRAGPRRRALVPAVALLILVDYWPAPFPLTEIAVPQLYTTLRDLPAGAVCELPLGYRSGFGEAGGLDDRVLMYQMVHGHPLVGGVSARIPERLVSAYEQLPVVRSLLQLSAGAKVAGTDAELSPAATAAALNHAGIRYVVINRAAVSRELAGYVERSLPLALVAREGDRELYQVSGYDPSRSNLAMTGP